MGKYTNEHHARNYALECENKAFRGTILFHKANGKVLSSEG